MSARDQVSEDGAEIDLFALGRMAAAHKLLISLVTLVFIVLAVTYGLLATPIYRAQVVITPVHDSGMGGGSSMLADQLGGLASLAGVNLPENNSEDQTAQAVLDSQRLVEEYVRRGDLVPLLKRREKKKILTLWLAAQDFKHGVVNIRQDQRKGITTVAVEWTDPVTAARWANGFVALANELMRTRALEDATRNVEYLKAQVERTNDVDMRKVIFGIIQSETKKLMLANGRAEYAFQVVDPAVPPEIRASPQRSLIVIIATAVGLFIGMLLTYVLERARGARRREALHAAPASADV